MNLSSKIGYNSPRRLDKVKLDLTSTNRLTLTVCQRRIIISNAFRASRFVTFVTVLNIHSGGRILEVAR